MIKVSTFMTHLPTTAETNREGQRIIDLHALANQLYGQYSVAFLFILFQIIAFLLTMKKLVNVMAILNSVT
jgi:hypothetical protein